MDMVGWMDECLLEQTDKASNSPNHSRQMDLAISRFSTAQRKGHQANLNRTFSVWWCLNVSASKEKLCFRRISLCTLMVDLPFRKFEWWVQIYAVWCVFLASIDHVCVSWAHTEWNMIAGPDDQTITTEQTRLSCRQTKARKAAMKIYVRNSKLGRNIVFEVRASHLIHSKPTLNRNTSLDIVAYNSKGIFFFLLTSIRRCVDVYIFSCTSLMRCRNIRRHVTEKCAFIPSQLMRCVAIYRQFIYRTKNPVAMIWYYLCNVCGTETVRCGKREEAQPDRIIGIYIWKKVYVC